MNMIEKVARAIHNNVRHELPEYDKLKEVDQKRVQQIAKFAIEAMLEPTNEMIEAGCDPFEHIDSQEQVKDSFKLMIQAALKE